METKLLHFFKPATALCLLCLVWWSCNKKELPLSTTNEPVFRFDGQIGNAPVTFTAGLNTLYMFTDYYKDSQSLLTLRGFFAPYNCTSCEPYLGFEFKDAHTTIEEGLYASIEQFFDKSYFHGYSLDSVLTAVPIESFKFIPDNNPPSATYKWYFGDGDSSTLLSPVHTFKTGGLKDVMLVVTLNNMADTISIPIETSTLSTCRTRFNAIVDTGSNSVTFNAQGVFNSYAWTFGDGSSGIDVSTTHVYNTTGLHEVVLITSGQNCLATYKRKVLIGGGIQQPIANFYYSNFLSSETSFKPRINKSSCVITLRQGGKEYKSYKNDAGIDQSTKTIFTVTGMSTYENNALGYKTVKISGSIDLALYNTKNSNDSIMIKSNSLEIAVAYP